MKTLSTIARKRLNMQGFVDLSDTELAEIRPWLRVSPALTVIWIAAGLFFGSAKVIWAIIPFSILGALLPGHPFDVLYNFGIHYLLGKRALPRYHLARRSCCLMASIWAGVVGWAFHSGATDLGYILGVLFIGAALLPVTIDFCIPAHLYGLIFGKPVSCSMVIDS
ncbi:DUF4395 domain-containing protein [candidate division KSB1 bacterium]|nr:DUF4395 domain-containing protein [candidate division KSB1 bacterium]